jgi:hypothetical protein
MIRVSHGRRRGRRVQKGSYPRQIRQRQPSEGEVRFTVRKISGLDYIDQMDGEGDGIGFWLVVSRSSRACSSV